MAKLCPALKTETSAKKGMTPGVRPFLKGGFQTTPAERGESTEILDFTKAAA